VNNFKKQKRKRWSLLKNLYYALDGLYEVLKHEMPFRIEVITFVILTPVIFILPLTGGHRAIIFAFFFLVLIVELMNSAVERCVDLTTRKYHILAKRAKNAASSAVLLSIVALIIIGFFFVIKDCFFR